MGPGHRRRSAIALWLSVAHSTRTRPNLLLALVDDLGYGDVGYNDPAMVTPEINSLAKKGIILDRFYAASTCTPTRAALMTGRHAMRTGMQDSVIHATEPRGVPLTETFLPEKLRSVGYRTAMVGKWHLGFHEQAYTPLRRGFDLFYGILPGGGSHTGHFSVASATARGGSELTLQGFNLWENDVPSPDNQSPTHSTHLYTAKAQEYIAAFEDPSFTLETYFPDAKPPVVHAATPRRIPRRLAASTNPWFVYLSYQAVHDPVEVGDAKYVQDTACALLAAPRDELCGMVAEVDDGLKTIRLTLEDANAWDRTLLIVASDNGGVLDHGSSNTYLRGEKATYFEGGVRVPLVLSGGFVAKHLRGRRLNSMVHITDLHATFLSLAGYASTADKALDGVDLGPHLFQDAPPPRDEVLINMNSAHFGEAGALIVGDFKYTTNAEPSEAAVYAHVRRALAKEAAPNVENLIADARNEVVGATTPTLFDLAKNPAERTDCATIDAAESCDLYAHPDYRAVRASLEARWAQYRAEMVASTFAWADDGPLADPALFDGVWAPWRDAAGPRATYAGLGPVAAAQLNAIATPASSVAVTTAAVGLLSFVLGASLVRWKQRDPRRAYLPIAEDY